MIEVALLTGLIAMFSWGFGNFIQKYPMKQTSAMTLMFSVHFFSIIVAIPVFAYMVFNGYITVGWSVILKMVFYY